MRRSAPPPQKQSRLYRQIWRVVDGAVRDAFRSHPDYLTEKGKAGRCAILSINKRVTGALVGYAEQSVQSRSGEPAADMGGSLAMASSHEAVVSRSEALPRCKHGGA